MYSLDLRRLLALGIAGGATAVLVLGVVSADAHAGRNRTIRNITVGHRNVGRMNAAQLNAVIDELEGEYRTTPIRVAATKGGFTAPGSAFGIAIDRPELLRSIRARGRSGGVVSRLAGYVTSFGLHRRVDIPVTIDSIAVAATLETADASTRRSPVDPELVVKNSKFQIIPGSDGVGIPVSAIAAQIPALVRGGPQAITVSVNRVVLPSRYSNAQAEALLEEATRRTSNPLRVVVGDKGATISPTRLRTWVKPDIINGTVTLTIDEDAALAGIRKVIGTVGTPARDARLSVDGLGIVTAVPSAQGLVCCDERSVERLNAALSATEPAGPVTLDLKTVEPKLSTEAIMGLGVREKVASFTTKHRPGEDRVKNIHHIADLLRGVVIQPGETFSVNDTIGPRSAANGFVTAHVIEDGVFAENFGGGISQFATTMFNAAFFGGLDLVEYQSHSLYISRYPYGREATLSYPKPDLKVKNITPYGILIWPTYTDRTITVDLYSTKFVTGAVVDQTKEPRDQCTIVHTTRLRTFVDGRPPVTDMTRASYRPKEGVDCKGNPTAGATTIPPRVTAPSQPDIPRPATTKPSGDRPSNAGDSTPPSGTTPDDTRPPTTKARKRPVTVPEGITPARPPVTGVQ